MTEEPQSTGAASEAERVLVSELDHEALLSERLRAKFLMIFCGVGGIGFLLLQHFFADYIELFRMRRTMGERMAMSMGVMLIYELIVWTAVGRVRTRGQARAALRWRYLSTMVELLLPTVLVFSFIETMHPVYGLLMPPTSLYFLFILLSALRLDFGICLLTGVVSAAAYLTMYVFGMKLYSGPPLILLLSTPFHHITKAVGFVVCGVTAGVVTRQLKQRVTRSLRLVAERDRVTAMFGLYVSPRVVEQLMGSGMELGGEVRDICVLFLDIRKFTQFAEKRAPQEVVRYLNALYTFMIDIVSEHNGIINKFLGDGFMAIFGAPLGDGREREQAIGAALAMVARLDEEVAAGRLPPTRVGIGIHYGPALTGSIGSPRRKEYTIIGDTVNLASRIEQLSKQHSAQILVSHSVLQGAPGCSQRAERIGEVAVRGREAPLELYKLA